MERQGRMSERSVCMGRILKKGLVIRLSPSDWVKS